MTAWQLPDNCLKQLPETTARRLRDGSLTKEVCNGGVACSLLKLGSLEKTVIASLFHSGLHSSSPFLSNKTTLHDLLPSIVIVHYFTWKRLKKFYDAKLIFWLFATFFVLTIFWSGAKQTFCFRESMSVFEQNGRIQALGFLTRWRLTSHALYYKIP